MEKKKLSRGGERLKRLKIEIRINDKKVDERVLMGKKREEEGASEGGYSKFFENLKRHVSVLISIIIYAHLIL